MGGQKDLSPNGVGKSNPVIDKGTLNRSKTNAPQVAGIFSRNPKDRYIFLEGRETPSEVKASQKTPGKGMIADKNRMGAPYAWLIYDFAVGEAKLKKEHRQYLQSIFDELSTYGRTYTKTGTILISGHASLSGIHGQNTKLASNRAKNVLNTLVKIGPVASKRMPRDWFYIRNKQDPSAIYSVVKGIPTTPWKRALCRGVYIVLWLMRDVKKPDLFPTHLRKKARGQIPHRFQKYEEYFYYWVIDNWEYLRNPKNDYVLETFPRFEDGLFFQAPKSQLETDKMVWRYLKNLHNRFIDAEHRLKHKYTGIPGHSFLPAGGDPVRCYQQLARWIALDGHARQGDTRVFHFTPGASIQKSFNELIKMINDEKNFGEKKIIWDKIEKYMKAKRIPMGVVKQPVK